MSDKPIYDMTGILFAQDEKTNERAPDWKGNITIEGKEWEIAAWDRQGNKGPFKTLKVSEKRRKDVSGTIPATSAPGPRTKTPTREPVKTEQYSGGIRQPADDQFDDDIPF